LKTSNVYDRNLDVLLDYRMRYADNQGGTGSTKTYSLLQLFITIAHEAENKILSIVSETVPHLKRGAMRDFFDILQKDGVYNPLKHNKTDFTYKVNNNIIEFFAVDSMGKAKGARRDYLFINECNNVPYPIADQLMIRTRKKIFLDYNPDREFWVHNEIRPKANCQVVQSTYKDNPYLEKEIVEDIESRRGDNNWWRVYGLGEIGSLEGLVYTSFEQIDKFPVDENGNYSVKHLFYGLDFGYSNHPTSLLRIGVTGDNVYIDELVYEKKLTNANICERFIEHDINKNDPIWADSAEPKSIQEIFEYGFNIDAAVKGADSIKNGIDILKRYNLHVTKSSLNTIKEFRNYTWDENKEGERLDKPIDAFNHSMDALRYGVTMQLHHKEEKKIFAYQKQRINR